MQLKTKPQWLNKKIDFNKHLEIHNLIGDLNLKTICKEAMCPNISECFQQKQATFLILGNICTRQCLFCNVTKSLPVGIDPTEPERIVKAIKRLGLRHVVITSPTRDDLPDGGALTFVNTVNEIKKHLPNTGVELLIPDFQGMVESIKKVSETKADILGHNIETVKRLYKIRQGADYKRSLEVLKIIKEHNPFIKTKSGLMLGLGEKEEEVYQLFEDLLSVDCRFLSIGQYLAPSLKHYPVQEYIRPEVFEKYKHKALTLGFSAVESGSYVRSSYIMRKTIYR